jgi:hypothetical protein
MSKSSLHRASKKFDPTNPNSSSLKRSIHNRQSFTSEQKITIHRLSNCFSETKPRPHLYDTENAEANEISIPHQWRLNKAAGSDWFALFLKRSKKTFDMKARTN